jgi:nitrogen regulatory protein PII
MVVADTRAGEVLATLAAAARTGKIGDGKIFVFEAERFVFATTSAVKLRYNAPPPLN